MSVKSPLLPPDIVGCVFLRRNRTAELAATGGRCFLSRCYRKAILGIMIWRARLTSA